jgi:hypothetical protein
MHDLSAESTWRNADRLYRQACDLEAQIAILWRKQGLKPNRTMRIMMKARRRITRRQTRMQQAWDAL